MASNFSNWSEEDYLLFQERNSNFLPINNNSLAFDSNPFSSLNFDLLSHQAVPMTEPTIPTPFEFSDSSKFDFSAFETTSLNVGNSNSNKRKSYDSDPEQPSFDRRKGKKVKFSTSASEELSNSESNSLQVIRAINKMIVERLSSSSSSSNAGLGGTNPQISNSSQIFLPPSAFVLTPQIPTCSSTNSINQPVPKISLSDLLNAANVENFQQPQQQQILPKFSAAERLGQAIQQVGSDWKSFTNRLTEDGVSNGPANDEAFWNTLSNLNSPTSSPQTNNSNQLNSNAALPPHFFSSFNPFSSFSTIPPPKIFSNQIPNLTTTTTTQSDPSNSPRFSDFGFDSGVEDGEISSASSSADSTTRRSETPKFERDNNKKKSRYSVDSEDEEEISIKANSKQASYTYTSETGMRIVSSNSNLIFYWDERTKKMYPPTHNPITSSMKKVIFPAGSYQEVYSIPGEPERAIQPWEGKRGANDWFNGQVLRVKKCSCGTFSFLGGKGARDFFKRPAVSKDHIISCSTWDKDDPLKKLSLLMRCGVNVSPTKKK